jgi:uncharacterized protein with FMN-binding domain
MNKLISTTLATAVVVLPAGAVWTATHSHAQNASASTNAAPAAATHAAPTVTSKHATATAVAKKTATAVAKKKATTNAPTKALKIQGPGVDMQWGTVQVTIVVKGNTVTDMSATAPTERSRSAYINGIAVPMLRQEVLQAKTVANIQKIYGISGATMTSEAFYQSLLAALKSAHLM